MISPYTFKNIIIDYEILKIQFLEWQNDIGLVNE